MNRFRARLAVVVAGTALAAIAYVGMRAATARSITTIRSFEGYCERVRPPDVYPCHVSTAGPVRAYLIATLVIWIGLAGIVLVLALAGRRLWAFAPLVALVGMQAVTWLAPDQLEALPWLGVRSTPFWTGELGEGYWASHELRAASADLALLAVPGLLLLLALRPPAAPSIRWRSRSALRWTTALCVTVGAAVAWYADGSTWQRLGFSTGIPIWVPAAVMATFGLLLPRGPWRPWSILFAAVVLSGGPSAMLVSASLEIPTTLWFAPAVPLAAIGLVTSAAEPLAARWERRLADQAREPAPADRRDLRPVVVVNALAIGLLTVSVIAASADPLPAQIGTALPTYLGIRDRAQDARAKLNLLDALEAATAFRASNPDLATFDAAAGRVLEPSLRWTDSARAPRPLTVIVLRASADLVRLATLSASGAAICTQATRAGGWASTSGVGEQHGTDGAARSLAEAVDGCDDEPFTIDGVPDLPVDTMCDGTYQDGIVICRAVQHLVREILASPRGRGLS